MTPPNRPPAARLAPLAAAMLLLLTLTGCALTSQQRLAIERFSDATATLADLAADQTAQMRRDVIALRSGMLELDADGVDLSDPALDLDGPLDADDAEQRLTAIAALRQFGQLLHDLAQGQTNPPIEPAGPLQTAVLHGAQWVADAAAGGDVRRIVLDTRQPVQQLAADLRDDFDPDAGLWAAGLTQTVRQIDSTLARQLALQQPPQGADAPPDSDAALRRARYNALRSQGAQCLKAFDDLRPRFIEALDQFDRAHASLVYVVQAPHITAPDIDAFAARVEELRRVVELIRH